MTLDLMPKFRSAEILKVGGQGASVRVVQIAPLGDPLEIELDGWRVSLRRTEAATLEVKAT